ncbi:MAG: histidine phosphatase family protein [Bacteroidetes bacterium]|nr:histidine phosphatase family protein [Bacteroidota bacterium]
MKLLYIVRHAKSSWDHPGLEDYQRPLLEKGEKRTKYVVDYLLQNHTHVDLILSSHATRALETAKIIASAIAYPENRIMISKNIYHGDSESLFNHFYDLSDEVTSLMMVGHNPAFTYAANYFLDKPIDNLPTSGVVCIEFQTTQWQHFLEAPRKTKFVVSPRSLKDHISRKRK